MVITINVDVDFERKLLAIQQVTGLNTAEIIEQAIDFLYVQMELKDKFEDS